jgi:predicted hydrocarbon binding protein
MITTASRPAEIAVPSAALGALRRALSDELGEDVAARVLRNAGHDAGDAFYQILAADAPTGLAELDATTFWKRFAQLFSSRGWGALRHSDVHPGVAVLEAADWSEADAAGSDPRPACYFTTGLLANVLGKVAGSDVSVMEVECRSRGDGQCRFLFGSPEALRGVYELLLSGESTEDAVSQLT